MSLSNSQHQPLITIGISCFNASKTIARVIESALQQDWPNFEILIVDDASDDTSSEIIKSFQQKEHDEIIVYCHDSNRGYASVLNTIIKHAKGEYIAFFDDDDEHEIERLAKQFKRLVQFESLYAGYPVLCYSHRRVFVNDVEKLDAFVRAIGCQPPEPHGPIVADFLLWHKVNKDYAWGAFGSCTMMAAKRTLEKFGFDPKFRRCAEWDLAVRVALQGGYFIAVDEPLVCQHKTQTSDKSGSKPLKYALLLRKKHKKYLKNNHVYFAAILKTYSNFYFFRKQIVKGWSCLILACLIPPFKVAISEIVKYLSHAKRKGK